MRLFFWKKKSDPMGPLVAEIMALRAEIRFLASVQARVVFPVNAMSELTGELRALRNLLDPKGRYAFMDSVRAKEELEAERKKLEEDRKKLEEDRTAACGGKKGDGS